MKNIERTIVNGLVGHARDVGEWAQPISYIRKLTPTIANELIIGVMFDRSIRAERAWEAAEWVVESLGEADDVTALWRNLTKIEPKRLRGFLRYGHGGYAFHRHYRTFSRALPKAATLILERYDGDPRKIWNSQKDVAKVRDRLEELPGIGPALSRMAVLSLARNHGLLGGKKAFRQMDVKPDIHVMRVFKRCGFITKGASPKDAIEVAQRLNPKFPAQLDAPAYDIGQRWCRPTRPNCGLCPIGKVCPRLF